MDKLRTAIRDAAPQSAQPESLEALGLRAQAAFIKFATPSVDRTIHFPLQCYDQLLGYGEAVANGLVDSKLLPSSTAAGDGPAATASAVLQPLRP